MKKQLLSFILLLLPMITFAQYTIFVDNIIYDINPYKNDIAKVARKNGGYSGNITIPETINYASSG